MNGARRAAPALLRALRILAIGLALAGRHATGDDAAPLTRAELAGCLADTRALQARSDTISAGRAALDAELGTLKELEARIAAGKLALDDTDTAAVAAYNALIDEHQRRADAFNAKLSGTNADIAALNAARRRYDRDCAHRAYDERDRAVLDAAP